MEPVKLGSEAIKKLVFGLESLDQQQRGLIKETLMRLARSSDGRISPEELRLELSRLRAAYKISEIDAKAVFEAVFHN
jgi:hypothetical protein